MAITGTNSGQDVNGIMAAGESLGGLNISFVLGKGGKIHDAEVISPG